MSNAALASSCLSDLKVGESGVIERLDLAEEDARRLMELGFLPGASVLLSRRTPFGDPNVFRIDDSEIALRRETAMQIRMRAPQ